MDDDASAARSGDPPGSTPQAATRGSGGWAAAAIVVSTVAFHLWLAGRVELSPQEAYYWQYARHLDASYFDHPPLAAWTIHATTALLGATERGVRAAAAVHAAILAVFLFLAGRRLFGARTALLGLGAAVLTPLVGLGQLVITPDGPLLAGWAACFYFTVRAIQERRGAWLLAAGVAAGAASLGKYTGFLLAPQVFLALLLDARGRPLLRTPWPWLALAVAAASFAPVVLWNAAHGWASFGFQFADRGAALAPPSPVRVGRFLGLQAALVTPGVLVGCWIALVVAARRRSDAGLRLCAVFAVPPLAAFAAISPFTWVKGNWPAPGYPTAVLAAAALLAGASVRWRWFAWGSVGLAALATVYFHLGVVWEALPFPARDATTLGWRSLAARVEAELPAGGFVAGCGYKVASELAFYLRGRPETFSSNAFGMPGLQYRFWGGDGALAGRTGIVVWDRRREADGCADLARFCAPLEPLPSEVLRRGGDIVTTFELWRCAYRGGVGAPAARAALPGAR